jgi:hypothetical protein
MPLLSYLSESVSDTFESTYISRWIDNPNFKRWFGDSKVVDDDGNPKIVYHGTTKSFDVFEKGDIGFHFGTSASANERLHTRTGVGFNPRLTIIDLSNAILPSDIELVTGQISKQYYQTHPEIFEDARSEYFKEVLEDLHEILRDMKIQTPEQLTQEVKQNAIVTLNQAHGAMTLKRFGIKLLNPHSNVGAFFLHITNPLTIAKDIGDWADYSYVLLTIAEQLYDDNMVERINSFYNASDLTQLGYIDKDTVLDYLKKYKFDGIKYLNDWEDRGSYSYIALEPTQIKSVFNSGSFSPNDPNVYK